MTYTVTPTKTGDTSGIDSADAIKIGRFAAGLDIPTANQRIAADVDGDGLITSYDASLVARYVNSLPGTANVGTWSFVPANRVYPCICRKPAESELYGDPARRRQ